jgi:hypothetical protein
MPAEINQKITELAKQLAARDVGKVDNFEDAELLKHQTKTIIINYLCTSWTFHQLIPN